MNNLQKIVILGPTYPFKGGIAHYNSLLARELAKKYDVQIISFKFQYPSFIYPGKDQKDFDDTSFEFDKTEYLINSINPFSWVKTAWRISRHEPDLIIVPWWNPFFGPAFFTITTLAKMLCDVKVLFIDHNIFPHERLPFDRIIAAFTLKRGDFHIVHSHDNELELSKLLKKPIYAKTPHPTYKVFKHDDISKKEAREKLGLASDEKTILFFGFIRKYKGLMYLINSLPVLRERFPKLRLLVVGDFYEDKQKYLDRIEELNLFDVIDIYDDYIPEREVGMYFSASDIVALPYTSATQSGIVQIAYGFSKPVVVTSVGGLPETVIDGKTGYIVTPKDSMALAQVLCRFFEDDNKCEIVRNIENEQENYTWHKMAKTIEGLIGK